MRSCQEREARQAEAFRAGVARLRRTPPDSLHIIDDDSEKRLTDPLILRKLPGRMAGLRSIGRDVRYFRMAGQGYRIVVFKPHLPAHDLYLTRTDEGYEELTGTDDTIYLDNRRRFFAFIDSLYQQLPVCPASAITINLP